MTQPHCIPCQSAIAPLAIDEAQRRLVHLSGWSLSENGTAITREFAFHNYTQANDFINKIGKIAEQENHHPDIQFGWGYARVSFTTHSIGGLHENDFIMAAYVNKIAAASED